MPPVISCVRDVNAWPLSDSASGDAEAPQDQHQYISELFVRFRHTGDPTVRDQLVELHLRLVRYVAVRFTGRGEPFQDIYQVGCLGLLKAVDRFDPSLGFKFLTFAIPTISGEIRRYFRDLQNLIRMPRLLQSRGVLCAAATDALTTMLGRSPTVAEVAVRAGLAEEMVLEAQEARQARYSKSIEPGGEDEAHRAVVGVSSLDANLEGVDNKMAVERFLQHLSQRERDIVVLSYEQQVSQRDIAARMGLSQMHISRLLARALATMRASHGTGLVQEGDL